MLFSEIATVQKPVVDLLMAANWLHVQGKDLSRPTDSVIVESEVRASLLRLNPLIADLPERADEIIVKLRLAILTTHNDGLVHANQTLLGWMRGEHTHQFAGTTTSEPVRLIDFDEPLKNSLIVSDEVSYGVPGSLSRFDIVLWVNGLPVVVGETKTATDSLVSWFNAAKDIHDVYEEHTPAFFTTNVLSFATEGKEFFYGAVRQELNDWERWGSTLVDANISGWPRVELSVNTLLSPRTILNIIQDFTLFENRRINGVPTLSKILPRYPQYEAVNAIVDRALDPVSRNGLLFHTQGSGKTLAMVYAAAKLVNEPRLKNPTVIMIADRVQLVRQTYDQFRTAAMPSIREASSAANLRSLLSQKDQRGIIFTTIHKFNRAGVLTDRSNVIVLIDEAHRTTEGSLGAQLRAALPNAALFGFTGTPIADADRNTFKLFGDRRDNGHALSTYDSDRAIADGVVVPMHVAARVVRFNIDRDSLEAEFEALAESEGLDDEEKDLLATKSGRLATFVANPERIRTVCEDIIEHFYSVIEPSGMKAQIVVYDRAMCVAYAEELSRLLAERAAPGTAPDQAAVVMTLQGKNDDGWAQYALSELQEENLLNRFRDFIDPLTFLIVTAKLGTGFNAPIEGVMYLDKPLKMHTLFQTITRTNRNWKNPITGQEKKFGLIVDYFGLGDGFARAMTPADPKTAQREIDIEGLLDVFEDELELALERFAGIDRSKADFAALQDARSRLPDEKSRGRFAARYLVIADVWEALYPDVRLEPHRDDYRWLTKVYLSVQPSSGLEDLLWHRLGAKTTELVHRNITDIEIDDPGFAAVISDEDTIRRIQAMLDLNPPVDIVDDVPTVAELIDSIAKRIKKRLEGGAHPAYVSLADRLERLRDAQITRATDSVDYLKRLFELAKDLKHAEVADDSGELDLLPDPRIGALTQIFEEFSPADVPLIIGDIVRDIDKIVGVVSYDGWLKQKRGDGLVRIEIRHVLKNFGLPLAGELFDRAYAYIAEHY
jgi:type I restriction enzyme R subunit